MSAPQQNLEGAAALAELERHGLYSSASERDNCGVGFVAHMAGERSHQILTQALQVLAGLTHRGGVGADPDTGDGCGVLVQIPHRYFATLDDLGFELPDAGEYAVAQVFLPMGADERARVQASIDRIFTSSRLKLLGWRAVPTDDKLCGKLAAQTRPSIHQLFIAPDDSLHDPAEFERALYVARKRTAYELGNNPATGAYFCSLSSRTLVYKGLLLPDQLHRFYVDLSDPRFDTALALVHQRFSTNTFPSWERAHPYRLAAHNGEINTLKGNRSWLNAREAAFESEHFGDDIKALLPIANHDDSDSANFDNMLELLLHTGRSLPHAMMMMIPEAWESNPQMEPERRAFYEYHASLMEPWDGPALVVFSDGTRIGASLDRNGLRPGRYAVTHDDLIVMASEAGVIELAPDRIRALGRLQPGRMLLVDTSTGTLVDDTELKAELSSRRPYADWLDASLVRIGELPSVPAQPSAPLTGDALTEAQQVHGYTREDLRIVLAPMAETAQEAIGAMGDDSALAVLSERPQPLFNYFKQLFAQVTNPPIDAIRESTVMSLRMLLGARSNLFAETPEHCRQLELDGPVVTNKQLADIVALDVEGLRSRKISMLFEATDSGLETALNDLCQAATDAVENGVTILVLSDRGHSEKRLPIPSLLAASAVHHHLMQTGCRHSTSLVVEAGDVREVMHFCLLVGYGASAVNPYLTLDTLAALRTEGLVKQSAEEAEQNYITAIDKGVLKVLSKMGISTLSAYHGAQVFEALGLGDHLVESYFPGTPSRLGGIEVETLEHECRLRHEHAYNPAPTQPAGLDWGSHYKWRRDGEKHQVTPNVVGLLQHSARSADYAVFKKYSRVVNRQNTRACELRGLLEFKQATPIDIEQVEPAAEIVKRFRTGAMSFGSLSKEAHETLAIAMNKLGGRSNSGEGGEDPDRHTPDANGEWRNSAIKQIASGRFGVTPEYLLSASELQIKMAQGAKPGEGGHLPGHKVDDHIARVRHSVPGIDLISPPPHHDIYSIEDLAQLIHDLHHSNPAAEVSVKLVSEIGVGTIAAGVAKAKAERIVVSGHSGGTGASPLSSIKHAGLPWELGLAETQQVLVANNLRGRVALETDGQLKTGRDIVIAAMLGADSFSFGTAALIASGCILMRVCHLNTCPVGVATQDPELRKRFEGLPDHVMNFMLFVAEEVREILASLGVTRLDDIIGQSQLLTPHADLKRHWKARHLDLSRLLCAPEMPADAPRRATGKGPQPLERCLDHDLLAQSAAAINDGETITIESAIGNRDRSVGTLLSAEITRAVGAEGLAPHSLQLELDGAAGQSLGAFLAPGVDIVLRGVANDAVGKGMAGGRIVVRSRSDVQRPSQNVRIGNVALYGATSGELYVEGSAGERFAVRNSGATAVVEGIGDHGCEYMTAGTVLVLGPTGRNFAAGMSGGIAYVLDADGTFASRCNPGMVDIEPLDESDEEYVHALVREHCRLTESPAAWRIASDWEQFRQQILKVVPRGPKRPVEVDPDAAVELKQAKS